MPLRPDCTMSVRDSTAASGFSAFLQSSFNNPSSMNNHQPLVQQYPRSFQYPAHFHRTMHMAQPLWPGSTSSDSGRTAPNPLSMTVIPFANDRGVTQMTSGPDHPFDSFLDMPDDGYHFGEWKGPSYWPDHSLSQPGNFRPTEFYNGSFNGNFNSSLIGSSSVGGESDSMIRKVDNSITLPTPAVFPHKIDPAQYEHINDHAWMLASVEYDTQSPGSFDSQSNGPDTPASPVPAGMLLGCSSGASKSSGSAMAGHCQCLQPDISFVEPTPLSTIWNAAQPRDTECIMFNNHPHAHGNPVGPVHPQSSTEVAVPFPNDSATASVLRDSVQCEMETSPELSDSEDESQGSHDVTEPDVSDHQPKGKSRVIQAHRRDRDDYLLKMREKGYSYKEIKRRGRFREAESTLRGRVRVLTKDKSERVRKPEWTANDLHLLHHALDRFGEDGYMINEREPHGRVPWKKISQWMHTAGSSYLFAPATCAKKWREVS